MTAAGVACPRFQIGSPAAMLTPDLFAAVVQCLSKNLEPAALGVAIATLAPLLVPDPAISTVVENPRPRRRAKARRNQPRRQLAHRSHVAAKQARRANVPTGTKPRSGPAETPQQRARAVLEANPAASLREIARSANCSRSTARTARQAFRASTGENSPRAEKLPSNNKAPKPPSGKNSPPRSSRPAEANQLDRAQTFLRQQLKDGPRPASDIEAAATKADIGEQQLDRAKETLGLITARASSGGPLAVTLELPT